MHLDRRLDFRLRTKERARIMRAVKHNPEKYFSVSHFIRCGILKQLNEVEEDDKNSDI